MASLGVVELEEDYGSKLVRVPAEQAARGYNFWEPGGGQRFRALDPGGRFLFRLHSPDDFLVGGGFFVRHTILPVKLAWDAFGEKNGVSSVSAFYERIAKYRRRGGEDGVNPAIGCNILTVPFCGARRMAGCATLLVDELFAEQPVRQWVLSVPYPLRVLFASRSEVMGGVLGIV